MCVSIGQSGRVAGSTNVVQRMNVALGERGDRLTRAEDKTVELMHKAQQFADTAHKVRETHNFSTRSWIMSNNEFIFECAFVTNKLFFPVQLALKYSK